MNSDIFLFMTLYSLQLTDTEIIISHVTNDSTNT